VFTLVGLAYAQIGAADMSRATVVKFNTICTLCHGGECSGRLSFSSGVEAAKGHVRRYIPSSSPLEVEELFAILKYTKENCAHYPLPVAAPADGVWDAEALQQWRSPESKGYFIPLGRMSPGMYRLGLRFDGQAETIMRITNEKFDELLEDQQCKDQAFDRKLSVVSEGFYYLHLKSNATLLGLTLALVPFGH